jgi:uncharacterized membrane protein YdbT with pleckstrin-like domain
MGFADSLLSSGERIVHREKQHWFVFVWGAKLTILAVLLAIAAGLLSLNLATDGILGFFRTILSWVTLALFVAGIANLIWTIFRYLSQEYVITNRRVMQVGGVLNKHSADSSLEKINDAVLTQSIFGRIFGFGDLEVLTAADIGIDKFQMIVDPIGFKKAMLEAKHDFEVDMERQSWQPNPPARATDGTSSPAGASADTTSTPTPVATSTAPFAPPAAATAAAPRDQSADELTRTLASLADLRDRGAISAEEYEAKKADLLGRL